MRPLTCCLHDGREAPGADRSPTGRARNGEKSPDSPICARTAGDARSRVTRPFSYSSQAQGRMVEFMKSLNYRLLFGKTNPPGADRTILATTHSIKRKFSDGRDPIIVCSSSRRWPPQFRRKVDRRAPPTGKCTAGRNVDRWPAAASDRAQRGVRGANFTIVTPP